MRTICGIHSLSSLLNEQGKFGKPLRILKSPLKNGCYYCLFTNPGTYGLALCSLVFNELFLLTKTILLAEDQHQTFRNKVFPFDSSIRDISNKKSDAANGRICKDSLSGNEHTGSRVHLPSSNLSLRFLSFLWKCSAAHITAAKLP